MEHIDLIKVISIIGAVIAFIITCYSKEHSKYLKLKEQYFNRLLVKFIKEYRGKKIINPIDFILNNYTYEDYYIPTYIRYLCEKRDKEKLRQVLVMDYKENFPSSRNSIFKTLNKATSIIDFFLVIFIIFVTMASLITFGMGLGLLIQNIIIISSKGALKFNEIMISGILIFLSAILFIVNKYFVMDRISEDDEYTNNTSKLEKIIKRKCNKYKRSKKRDYFY